MALEKEKHLIPYYQAQKTYKLSNFEKAKKWVNKEELDLLELWESMLTGRSAPVARWIKDQFQELGLNHLFTPSGFHLSAIMLPFMKLIKTKSWQLGFLLMLAALIFSLRGQGALKRMLLIKIDQNLFGQKVGFILALLMDMLFGSFNESPLSFCYSFLFLGIIYSGSPLLFLWFFFGQCLIAYFTGDHISPLIMIISPLLNLAFAMCMPLLFLLAIPLYHWQMIIGLKILWCLQKLVEWSGSLTSLIPSWEINLSVLLCFLFFYLRKRKCFALCLLTLTWSLNPDLEKIPSFGSQDFVPQGKIIKIVPNVLGETVYWSDGKCKRELIRGIWWEKCSSKRRSTRKKA